MHVHIAKSGQNKTIIKGDGVSAVNYRVIERIKGKQLAIATDKITMYLAFIQIIFGIFEDIKHLNFSLFRDFSGSQHILPDYIYNIISYNIFVVNNLEDLFAVKIKLKILKKHIDKGVFL